jgi:peptidoglycan hydrolase-like protein with peptidoglycan-binding domain
MKRICLTHALSALTVCSLGGTAAAEGDQNKSQTEARDGKHSATGSASELSTTTIKDAQRALQAEGAYQGNLDGIAGPKTMQAVRNFQEKRGLPQSGYLDERTLEALHVNAEAEQHSRATSSTGMAGERQPVAGPQGTHAPVDPESSDPRGTATPSAPVEERTYELANLDEQAARQLQRRLQVLGHYQGEIDGVAGPQTREALRRYMAEQMRAASRGQVTDAVLKTFGLSASQIATEVDERQPVRGEQMP